MATPTNDFMADIAARAARDYDHLYGAEIADLFPGRADLLRNIAPRVELIVARQLYDQAQKSIVAERERRELEEVEKLAEKLLDEQWGMF